MHARADTYRSPRAAFAQDRPEVISPNSTRIRLQLGLSWTNRGYIVHVYSLAIKRKSRVGPRGIEPLTSPASTQTGSSPQPSPFCTCFDRLSLTCQHQNASSHEKAHTSYIPRYFRAAHKTHACLLPGARGAVLCAMRKSLLRVLYRPSQVHDFRATKNQVGGARHVQAAESSARWLNDLRKANWLANYSLVKRAY